MSVSAPIVASNVPPSVMAGPVPVDQAGGGGGGGANEAGAPDGGGGGAAAAGASPGRAAPQPEQNLPVISVPHSVQCTVVGPSLEPQPEQNLAPGAFAAPHSLQ